MSKHPIVHVEFSSNNREESGKFFSELFGWNVQQIPDMNYATYDTGEGVGGGLNPISDEYPAGTVAVYVGTDDIEATLARVEELGGKTMVPKMEIPGVGWVAFFSDPTGNMIGLWTDMPQEE